MSKVIGYVVKTRTNEFICDPAQLGKNLIVTKARPKPISQPAAHRLLAAFLEENSEWKDKDEPYVAPVFGSQYGLEFVNEMLGIEAEYSKKHSAIVATIVDPMGGFERVYISADECQKLSEAFAEIAERLSE